MRLRDPLRLLLAFALVFSLFGVVGCDDTSEDDEPAQTQASEEEAPPPKEQYTNSDPNIVLPNTEGSRYVIFAYEGENMAYHTGLLKMTPIIFKGSSAWTKSAKNFEETTSLGNPSAGEDRVEFSGTWNGTTLKGELAVSTAGKITFPESGEYNEFAYDYVGTLEASLVPGTNILKGTVKGSSVNTQKLSSSEDAEPDEQRSSVWAITGEIVGLEQ